MSRPPRTISERQVTMMARWSGLNPSKVMAEAKEPGKILILSWGRSCFASAEVSFDHATQTWMEA